MIALDSPVKIKKSPKKPLVQVPVVKKTEESDSEELEDSDAEEAGTDSPNEEMDQRKSISDDQTSSGAEGDESDAGENIDGAEGDESDASENIDDLNNTDDKSVANPGWADAMRKILNTKKPKRKKSIVLSKAKKLNDVVVKPKKVVVFEVENNDGEIKEETIEVKEELPDQIKTEAEQKTQKKKHSLGIRVKPSVLDREREKRLQKIATNGVVQLFNAVRKQQTEIKEKLIEAGPVERKREKALKNIDRRAFLDVLMGGTNKIVPDEESEEIKKEEEEDKDLDESGITNKKENKVWSVLRDDFVMGAKLKDWNKQDTDEDSSAPEEMDSD